MKTVIKVCIFCVTAFFSSCVVESGPKEIELGPLRKILIGYNMKSIAFDSKGNAWIVTQEQELIKYNEMETMVFNSTNSILPEEIYISSVAVDKKDNVWIGASDGVWKYDGKKFTLYNSQNTSMLEDLVWSIAVDSKNNVWMSSCRVRQGGLVKYDGTKWTVYTPNNSALPVNMIHGIAIDQSDNVWLALGEYVNQSYLVKISNDKWEVFDENDFGFKPYWHGGIQCDSRNRVLAGISYFLSSFSGPHFPDFFIFDGKKTTQLSRGDNISLSETIINHKDYVLCFGGVWIGEQWRRLDSSEFGGSSVRAVKEDPYHRIWVGTEDGIYISEKIKK